MSILGYFTKIHETRMPRADSRPDPLGIRWHGQVLEGDCSVQDAQLRIDRAAHLQLLQDRLRRLRGY